MGLEAAIGDWETVGEPIERTPGLTALLGLDRLAPPGIDGVVGVWV